MMKRNCFYIILLTLLGCSGSQNKTEISTSPAVELTSSLAQKDMLDKIELIRSKENNYFGDGIANIGTDLGLAKIEAENRAIADLSKSIKVEIRESIEIIIIGTSHIKGETHTAEVEESIQQKIETYTNLLLENPKEIGPILNYPQTGVLYYFVYFSKELYDEKVTADLNSKRSMIISYIKNGDKGLSTHQYFIAALHWTNARKFKRLFFGNLPLIADLDGDDSSENITAYLDQRVAKLFGNLDIDVINDNISYDVTGALDQTPIIYVVYKDENNEKHPFTQFPLQASILEGNGKIEGSLTTGNYGQAELLINQIDPSYKFTNVLVEIDLKSIAGLDKFEIPTKLSTVVHLIKKKTVALSVTFINDNQSVTSSDLKNSIRTTLLNTGYEVVSADIPYPELTPNNLKLANNTNADYLLNIFVKTGNASKEGPYNIYRTICSARVVAYILPDGRERYSESIEGIEGYANSASGAGWDGFGKIKPAILKETKIIIEKL